MRPSQCYSQECVDEKHDSKDAQPDTYTLTYFSPWQYKDTYKSVSSKDNGQTLSIRTLETGKYNWASKLPKIFNDIQEKEDKRSGCGSREEFQVSCKNCPPWHWEILLNQSSVKPCSESERREDKRNHSEDRYGTRSWEQREQFLLKHSILQALRWGSAVALTWSLYHDWGSQRCKNPLYKHKTQEQLYSSNKTQTIKSLYNEADHKESGNKNCSSEERSHSKDNMCNRCTQHESHRPDVEPVYNSLVGSHSPFSFLWNIISNQNKLTNQIFTKSALKDKPPDSILNDIVIPDIHSQVQNFQGHSTSEESLTQICEIVTASSVPTETQFMQYTRPIQSEDLHFEDSEGCLASELLEKSQASNLEQEYSQNSHVNKQNILPDNNKDKGNLDIGCTKAIKETREQNWESISVSAKPLKCSLKNEVKLQDLIYGESELSAGAGGSSEHPHQNIGITEFNDSFMEILSAGSQDIKAIQDKLLGVLESDVGYSIVDVETESAVMSFRAGSLLGDPSAMFNLALCYHLGHGVNQDLKMARELYEAASVAGHSWATYNLAVLVSQGQGGSSDLKCTYNLLIKAGEMGVREAQEALKLLEQKRNCVRKEDPLKFSKSEPSLTSRSSGMWSSYSTSDLEFMDESDISVSMEVLADLNASQKTSKSFYLGL